MLDPNQMYQQSEKHPSGVALCQLLEQIPRLINLSISET